ncbi:putative transposable element, partial [Pseudoloma neurophilia]
LCCKTAFSTNICVFRRLILIFANNIFETVKELNMKNDRIFKYNYASHHETKITKKWLSGSHFTMLPFAPNSPDLNPIENLFAYVKMSSIRKLILMFHLL